MASVRVSSYDYPLSSGQRVAITVSVALNRRLSRVERASINKHLFDSFRAAGMEDWFAAEFYQNCIVWSGNLSHRYFVHTLFQDAGRAEWLEHDVLRRYADDLVMILGATSVEIDLIRF